MLICSYKKERGTGMKKRFFSLLLASIMLACSFLPIVANAQSYEAELLSKGFPHSYIPALVELHKKYPKWTFNAFDTRLDWSSSVSGERSSHSKQLIQKLSGRSANYYCKCSSCYSNGSYVVREAGSWVSASDLAVAYYMDPRNWLDEKHIFQFETIKNDQHQTQAGVESILSKSWMANKDITYLTTGLNQKTYTSNGQAVKYSQAIMDASEYSGMSAYYLASRIVQEVGGTANAGGVTGKVLPFTGIYNFYSIGANAGANDGLAWACGPVRSKDNTIVYSSYDSKTGTVSGTQTKISAGQTMSWMGEYGSYYKVRVYNKISPNNYTTNGAVGYVAKSDCNLSVSYNEPWTNPYKSIYNGAKWIADNYGRYQFTSYLQKFNVNSDYFAPFTHEYMANVSAPASESEISYNAYSNNGLLTAEKVFYIPVYSNMPEATSPEPSKVVVSSTPPAKVEGVKTSNIAVNSVTISWNKTNNTSGYHVYNYNSATKESLYLGTVYDSTSFTHAGLSPNTLYEYYVVAFNSAGAGKNSAVISATTKNIEKPAAVTGLKLKSNSSSSVTISWNKADRAWGYYVYRYSSKTKKYTKIATINDGSTTSYKQSKLNAGSGYDYAVTAFNPGGSAKKSAILHTCTKPIKVESLKLTALTKEHSIKASWKKISATTGYQVQFSRKKDFSTVIATKTVGSKSTVSYTGKNFTKGNTYYIRVRAYKTANNKKYYGSWSSVKSIKAK